MTERKCSKCAITYDITKFRKRKSNSQGYDFVCKCCHNEYNRNKRAQNPSCRPRHKRHKEEQREHQKEYWKLYYIANRKQKLASMRKYRLIHPQSKKYKSEYQVKRKKSDIQFKLRTNIRVALHHAIKKNQQKGKPIELLGCSIEYFKNYIATQFVGGMSWDNWGRYTWNLDHIIPLISFDLTNPQQLKLACHYTNLRPLFFVQNNRAPSPTQSVPTI